MSTSVAQNLGQIIDDFLTPSPELEKAKVVANAFGAVGKQLGDRHAEVMSKQDIEKTAKSFNDAYELGMSWQRFKGLPSLVANLVLFLVGQEVQVRSAPTFQDETLKAVLFEGIDLMAEIAEVSKEFDSEQASEDLYTKKLPDLFKKLGTFHEALKAYDETLCLADATDKMIKENMVVPLLSQLNFLDETLGKTTGYFYEYLPKMQMAEGKLGQIIPFGFKNKDTADQILSILSLVIEDVENDDKAEENGFTRFGKLFEKMGPKVPEIRKEFKGLEGKKVIGLFDELINAYAHIQKSELVDVVMDLKSEATNNLNKKAKESWRAWGLNSVVTAVSVVTGLVNQVIPTIVKDGTKFVADTVISNGLYYGKGVDVTNLPYTEEIKAYQIMREDTNEGRAQKLKDFKEGGEHLMESFSDLFKSAHSLQGFLGTGLPDVMIKLADFNDALEAYIGQLDQNDPKQKLVLDELSSLQAKFTGIEKLIGDFKIAESQMNYVDILENFKGVIKKVTRTGIDIPFGQAANKLVSLLPFIGSVDQILNDKKVTPRQKMREIAKTMKHEAMLKAQQSKPVVQKVEVKKKVEVEKKVEVKENMDFAEEFKQFNQFDQFEEFV